MRAVRASVPRASEAGARAWQSPREARNLARMHPRFARRLLIAAVAAAGLTASTALAANPLPTLLTGSGENAFAVRPATINYTGDGSGVLGRFPSKNKGFLRWTSWGPQAAMATGTVWLNDCQPSCAGGQFRAYNVRLTADHVRGAHFTQMTLRYRYNGKAVVDSRTLERIGVTYQWAITAMPPAPPRG
jgi:hypothetical protein